jgi:hypothetical protein
VRPVALLRFVRSGSVSDVRRRVRFHAKAGASGADSVNVETVRRQNRSVEPARSDDVAGPEGIEVSARSTQVFTIENGQITRLRLFQERADALEAVGLRE